MTKATVRSDSIKISVGYELTFLCKQCKAEIEPDQCIAVIFSNSIMDFFCNLDCLESYIKEFKEKMKEGRESV